MTNVELMQGNLRLFALVSALLAIHLLALGFLTGSIRILRKQYTNPEDKAVIKGARVDSDHEDVLRARRAHLNALENAVPFFAVGALYASSGASHLGAQVYFFTFLAVRVLHSVFYMLGLQPLRSIAWGIGSLATLGMAIHVIRASI
jgi:uncharacterized MAPEG superfamily protein